MIFYEEMDRQMNEMPFNGPFDSISVKLSPLKGPG